MFQTAFVSDDTNKTTAVVLSLVEPLLEKGRMLWRIFITRQLWLKH
jgi:hypothetical protein